MTASAGGSATGRVVSVVLDCDAPSSLAAFWSALLDLPVTEKETDDWWELAPLEGGVTLAFQKVERHRPPNRTRPQQLHLDVKVADLEASENFVLGLGAEIRSDIHPGGGSPWRVYADPAGHPFCLVTE